MYDPTKEELERLLFDYGQVSEEGIIYAFELAGPNGADYFIYPAAHHSKEDIEATKSYIGNSFDCMRLSTRLFKGEYPIPRIPEEWTSEQREAGFRKIVDECTMGRVENCPVVDLFTASAVVQVIDNLSPENKVKMLDMCALLMIRITWDVLDGAKEKE